MEGPLEDDTEGGYELDMSHAIDAILSRFRSLDIVGKRALKSKVFELAYPTTTRFFCTGYVGGNHWVQVNMKQGFPLPEVMPEWKKYCSSEASSWISNLNGRLQYWKLLNPPLIPPIGPVNVDDD
ncbi:hypothetical protein P8452_32790 [Trifolium repens]|nr:hypothetical protein P8452_32790 [Trifolium repens]